MLGLEEKTLVVHGARVMEMRLRLKTSPRVLDPWRDLGWAGLRITRPDVDVLLPPEARGDLQLGVAREVLG